MSLYENMAVINFTKIGKQRCLLTRVPRDISGPSHYAPDGVVKIFHFHSNSLTFKALKIPKIS